MLHFLRKLKGLPIFFIFAMAVLSTHLAADAIIHIFEGLFDKMHWWHPLIYISFGLFFVVMISVTFLLKNRIYLPQTKIIPGGAQRRKHLILFLSNLDDLDELNKSNGIPEALTLTHNINDDIEKMKELKKRPTKLVWKWEMPLRAIKHHIETLTTLTIICSDKSLPQVHLFLNICRRYKNSKLQKVFLLARKEGYCTLVEKWWREQKEDFKSFDKEYEGFNFEDFNALSNAMAYLISKLKKKKISESNRLSMALSRPKTSEVYQPHTYS